MGKRKKIIVEKPKTQKITSVPHWWGYVFGSVLILLGLTAVSVAFGNALKTAMTGVHKIEVPGVSDLTLNPGVYFGVFLPSNKNTNPLSLDFSRLAGALERKGTSHFVPLERTPPGIMAMQNKKGVLLFRFEILMEGLYELTTQWDQKEEGESILVDESLSHNRADLAVGILLFLVLGGCGGFIVFRTYRKSKATI